MATQYDPIAKDESLNTTETPSRNIADVLAEELARIVTALGGGSLEGLNDVAIVTPSNGQTLKYNSTTQKWENANGGGGSGHTIENASGAAMTARDNLQFVGMTVADDPGNDRTTVTATAKGATFDSTGTSLSSTNAEDAIKEVDAKVDRGSVSVTADGVKTYGMLFNELILLVDFSKISNSSIFVIRNGNTNNVYTIKTFTNSILQFFNMAAGSGVEAWEITLVNNGGSYNYAKGTSTTDNTSQVPNNGRSFTVYY